ncbi:MAG: DNA mismatch repair protein MutS [Spirochaetales bacterium]|nr:DNA mismatch repair protein MutS [Spirochaetales bacterium]
MPEPTPMMRQYLDLKAEHPDKILFFRLGDFYEMFRQDAQEASKLLGLTLTHRQGEPMCGIPYHAASGYIKKLLDWGKRIAVCEQSASATGRGMMSRQVTEIYSPGTVVDDNFLTANKPQYVLALFANKTHFALTCADFSTGEILSSEISWEQGSQSLIREIVRLQPKEILISESSHASDSRLAEVLVALHADFLLTTLPDWYFGLPSCLTSVLQHFEVASPKALGWHADSLEVVTMGVILDYAGSRWPGRSLAHLKNFRRYFPGDFVSVDEATARSLEITQSARGGDDWTLFRVLDGTCTSLGGRRLRAWLKFPLKNKKILEARQDKIEYFLGNTSKHLEVRKLLGGMGDWERLSSRLSLDKAGPRDLLGLESSMEKTLVLFEVLEAPFEKVLTEEEFSLLRTNLSLLQRAIDRNTASILQEGGVIAEGFDGKLDSLRYARDHGAELLQAYADEEMKQHGLSTLRLKNNRLIGYFFEVSRIQSENLPSHFRRKQSLVTSERYTTDRLESLQETVSVAKERCIALEKELFIQLTDLLKRELKIFQKIAEAVGECDVFQGLAWVAQRQRYVRPEIHEGYELSIDAGRHPIVEAALQERAFVPNSVHFKSNEILHLLTGPNMSGKSTFLRQTALIVLMAQIGSYVPASSAKIALVDQIFCRVGSSDNLAGGESTFLVEMNEVSNILRNATRESLVIMDEVGRGTSTRDGLSLAWSICEYLLGVVKAKTLFATHYHELTELNDPGKSNYCVLIQEDGEEVIFLRKVLPGAAEHSYGIHVAKLAGLPSSLLKRAKEILEELLLGFGTESGPAFKSSVNSKTQQGRLFDENSLILDEIQSLDLDNTTPLEALLRLERWKRMLKEDS